jgi:anti-sigma factor RsiW
MATDWGTTNAACEKYEALLEDYLNGDLSAADAKTVTEHWQGCAGCRAALQSAAASLRLLKVAAPTSDPGPGFSRVVIARIREKSAGGANFWQPFVSFGWRFAATATLALAVFVSYNAGWGHRLQPKVTTARPTESVDLFAPEPVRVPANGDEVLMMVADNSHAKF